MALSFEDEMRAFLSHRYEQMPEVQEILVQGRRATNPLEGFMAVSMMIGYHNEAFLRVAQEIDALRTEMAD